MKKNESEFVIKNNQKIISFIGGKNGIGTTTLAVNVATGLATKGARVLFIELNPKTPSIGYWYQFEDSKNGLESALKAMKNGVYSAIGDSIVKSKNLKNGEFGKFYKRFPDSLDFMVFTNKETLSKGERMILEKGDLKELYFYMMQNYGYEYIVIDLMVDEEDSWVNESILFSTKIYSVVTQDVASIAYLKKRVDYMQKNGIPVDSKNSYVINMLEEQGVKLKAKELKEWFDNAEMYSCPNVHGDILNSIYEGVPAILVAKNKALKTSIFNIVTDIMKKNK